MLALVCDRLAVRFLLWAMLGMAVPLPAMAEPTTLTGAMKAKPASWKDLFFPNVYDALRS